MAELTPQAPKGVAEARVRAVEETDAESILRRADHLTRMTAVLKEAYAVRESGPAGLAACEDAARHASEALELMYPAAFWADVRSLQAGSPAAVEPALVFLEADPWCLRSGYAKETIVRLLRRHDLTPNQRERLEAVFLHVVEVGDRREFRLYVRLARGTVSRQFRDELVVRLHSADDGVARRALWMLAGLRHPRLGQTDVSRAREIVLLGARRPDRRFWVMPRWVGRMVREFWSDEWGHELASRAVGHGPDADEALRVLVRAPHVELDVGVHQRLTDRLVQVVDQGGDESFFERLAVTVDTPALRDMLEGRKDHPDADIRRRARWADNAIRRAAKRRADS